MCCLYLAVKSTDLSSTSDIITFDQNYNHLIYSSSASGKDLFNDAQIRVIGSIELDICTKCLENKVKNSEEDLLKLPVIKYPSVSYFTVKISCLDVLLFLSSLELI